VCVVGGGDNIHLPLEIRGGSRIFRTSVKIVLADGGVIDAERGLDWAWSTPGGVRDWIFRIFRT
jgi:hypothetical protein